MLHNLERIHRLWYLFRQVEDLVSHLRLSLMIMVFDDSVIQIPKLYEQLQIDASGGILYESIQLLFVFEIFGLFHSFFYGVVTD